MRTEHLDFITFCVGSLSDALNKSASQVYGALRSSGENHGDGSCDHFEIID